MPQLHAPAQLSPLGSNVAELLQNVGVPQHRDRQERKARVPADVHVRWGKQAIVLANGRRAREGKCEQPAHRRQAEQSLVRLARVARARRGCVLVKGVAVAGPSVHSVQAVGLSYWRLSQRIDLAAGEGHESGLGGAWRTAGAAGGRERSTVLSSNRTSGAV